MSDALDGYAAELDGVRREAAELLEGLTREQLAFRPGEKAWSIGQVAAHLRATNELYVTAMRAGMQRGPRGEEPHRPSLVGGFLVRAMTSPRRVPAPRVFLPPAADDGHDWSAELAGYRATSDALATLLGEARGLSLRRTRVASPVSRFFRMNLGDAFALWLAHDRRHLGQIRRVREHPGFPR